LKSQRRIEAASSEWPEGAITRAEWEAKPLVISMRRDEAASEARR
jgi:hypothetical protein